jgi:hypothetical protein
LAGGNGLISAIESSPYDSSPEKAILPYRKLCPG